METTFHLTYGFIRAVQKFSEFFLVHPQTFTQHSDPFSAVYGKDLFIPVFHTIDQSGFNMSNSVLLLLPTV